MADDGTLAALREALRVSPRNVPLRKHIAELLVKEGRIAEAETEYREALAIEPDSEELQLALAEVFREQGKISTALVIIEALVSKQPSARSHLAYSRLLLREGKTERAVQQYYRAIEADPDAADPALALELGVYAEDQGDGFTEVVDGRVRAPGGGVVDGESASVDLEEPDVTFSDVGGMEKLKEEIRMKIIHPVNHPDLYAAYGKKVGGGILMYGPPGCGKTHLARATAGEVKANFLAVGINDVLDMWLGESERKLHELFQLARHNTPCVLFFDEVDALGARRTDMVSSAGRLTINQFLAELDGIKSSNEGVLVLAATNAPWHLDSAFRRPGRFDRIIFVPPPDRAAREAILEVLLMGKPQEDIDLERIGARTEEFSGADLKAVVDTAIEAKLDEAIRTGRPGPLRTKDLLGCAKRLKPTTREWFATARNHALYSNQGGAYDDVRDYLKLL